MGRKSRRGFLRSGAAWATGGCLADAAGILARLAAQPLCPDLGDPGELLGLVPLHGDRGRDTPFGALVGGPGLDARLFTDLSALAPDRLVTPSAKVFIRTAAPPAVAPKQDGWTIVTTTAGGRSSRITRADLARLARPMGAHLIECAGNNDPDNFGLMSVADWRGVPLTDIVDRSGAAGVLVSGVDDESRPSWRSVPGASWIVPVDDLDELGAFLAVEMNGAALALDHGAPVRLVVPGWYGCSWIKWVDTVRLVGADEPATSQMREFAARTHQNGVPTLARDYQAPAIDLAATPVRVEKRRVSGRLEYRVIGIIWGGDRVPDRLTIRFGARETPVPFAICPRPASSAIWSLWEYRWRPTAPGTYDIVVKSADPAIRTRRLDLSFYARRVTIAEV